MKSVLSGGNHEPGGSVLAQDWREFCADLDSSRSDQWKATRVEQMLSWRGPLLKKRLADTVFLLAGNAILKGEDKTLAALLEHGILKWPMDFEPHSLPRLLEYALEFGVDNCFECVSRLLKEMPEVKVHHFLAPLGTDIFEKEAKLSALMNYGLNPWATGDAFSGQVHNHSLAMSRCIRGGDIADLVRLGAHYGVGPTATQLNQALMVVLIDKARLSDIELLLAHGASLTEPVVFEKPYLVTPNSPIEVMFKFAKRAITPLNVLVLRSARVSVEGHVLGWGSHMQGKEVLEYCFTQLSRTDFVLAARTAKEILASYEVGDLPWIESLAEKGDLMEVVSSGDTKTKKGTGGRL